jgi:hypothetical protein
MTLGQLQAGVAPFEVSHNATSYRYSVVFFSEKRRKIYSFSFFLPYLILLAYVFP